MDANIYVQKWTFQQYLQHYKGKNKKRPICPFWGLVKYLMNTFIQWHIMRQLKKLLTSDLKGRLLNEQRCWVCTLSYLCLTAGCIDLCNRAWQRCTINTHQSTRNTHMHFQKRHRKLLTVIASTDHISFCTVWIPNGYIMVLKRINKF